MKKKIAIFHILSFALPFVLMAVSFVIVDIYPGGEYTPFILDLKTEQLAFYNYLNNLSKGFNSLVYQSMGGLGGGVIDSLQMCCGPAVFLFSLFDVRSFPAVLWFIIVCMIGSCGLSEYIYLKNGFRKMGSDHLALLLSICYALMSCMVVYTIVPAWIWGGMLLPMVALGLDQLIDEKKYPLFIASVSLAIIADYYMAYILIVFSVIYFLYRVLILKVSVRRFLNLSLQCLTCGILSCLLSAFSWLPVLYDLVLGKGAENRLVSYGLIRNPAEVIFQLLPISYDGLLKHSLPFIYCGIGPVILLMFYFLNRKISRREKFASLILLIILFLCLMIGSLDIVWMFFAEPNGYPSRYSFVISFTLLMIAAGNDDQFSSLEKSGKLRILKPVLLVFVCAELCFNSVYMLRSMNEDVGPYAGYEEYDRVCDIMDRIKTEYSITGGTGRTVKNWRYTNDDGIMFGYPDIDYFSSSYNSGLHKLLTDLGLNGQFHLIRSTGLTPPVASVLNVEYLIQYGNTFGDYYSYLGNVDGLDIYHNDVRLPLAFAIEADLSKELADLGDDPFENINVLLHDLGGSSDAFSHLTVKTSENSVSVIPENGKRLWMYAKPEYTSGGDIHTENIGSYLIYADGNPIGEYANTVSPYSVELGTGAGMPINLTFEKNIPVQTVYMATYNEEETAVMIGDISDRAAYDVCSAGEGIVFSIDLDSPRYVMVTIPYLKGYRVYVDGVKTGYTSYRNALLALHAEAGHHDVVITYSAPGLKGGIIITIATLIGTIVTLIIYKRRSHMKINKSLILEKFKSAYQVKMIVSLYLSYLMVRGAYISGGNTGPFIFRLIFLVPVSALIVYALLTFLYWSFDRFSVKARKKVGFTDNTVIVFFVTFFILIVFYSIEFLAFYPGMFNFDGPDQLNMYLNGELSELNPLLHTLIIGKIIVGIYSLGFDISVGIAVYTIFQYSVIALCFSYMLRYVYHKCGTAMWIISCLFIAVFPTITLQVMSSTKDSFFVGFFVLFLTLSLELYEDNAENSMRAVKYSFWVISAFLVLVFRNNFILAFPVLMIALLKVSSDRKKTVISLISVILLFLCYKFLVVRPIVNVKYDTRELFSVPAQQMAAVYLDENSELSDRDREVIETFLGDNLREYIPEIADIVKISLNMGYYRENRGLVLKTWIDSAVHNPKTALRAFSRLNSGLWYPVQDLTLYWDGSKGYWPVGSTEPFYVDSKFVPLTLVYLWFSSTDFSNKPLIPVYLLFAPATFFYIFVIMWGYAVKNKRKVFTALFAFVFVYWSTYLLGPVALVRYVIFLYAILPLYFPLIIEKNRAD